MDARAAVPLASKSMAGLGFSIRGSMIDGIFIREVSADGPAKESNNVFAG